MKLKVFAQGLEINPDSTEGRMKKEYFPGKAKTKANKAKKAKSEKRERRYTQAYVSSLLLQIRECKKALLSAKNKCQSRNLKRYWPETWKYLFFFRSNNLSNNVPNLA